MSRADLESGCDTGKDISGRDGIQWLNKSRKRLLPFPLKFLAKLRRHRFVPKVRKRMYPKEKKLAWCSRQPHNEGREG
jgi:hypothetical protein